jgi:DNA-binding transcriptional LysR family regulator
MPTMTGVQTESLEVFRTVARYGSITSAARALGYTQSAVSRQVAVLEAQAGARLFDRLPRGVVLTSEGACLLPHAEAVVDRLAAARAELAALRGLSGGQVRVSAFTTATAALVPRALASFRQAHPGVGVTLANGLTPALLDGLAAGDADLAVVSAPAAAGVHPIDPARFTVHHLLDEHLLIAVPGQHRLAGRATARLAEFAEDAFIVGSATAEDTLLRVSLPPGFRPRTDIVAPDWTAKLGLVAAGLGVALIPALAIRSAPADLALLRLDAEDAPVRQVLAATAAGRTVPAAATALITHLRHAAAGLELA